MTRIYLISLLVVALAAGASAQSSSLFKRGANGRPTAQPAPASSTNVSPANHGQDAHATPANTSSDSAAAAPADPATPAATVRPTSDAGQLIGHPGQPAPADAAGEQAIRAGSMASPWFAGPAGGPSNLATYMPVAQNPHASMPGLTPAAAALGQVSFTASPMPPPRQYRPNDLVTIIVREETTYMSDGDTSLEKKASIDAKLEKWLKFQWANPPLENVDVGVTPQLKASGGRKFDGDGTVKRKDSFVGRLTAEIVDVKPNGTLLLSARKFIKTDSEEQLFQLSGTCRVEDITADNTVLSTQLADLRVSKTHRGAVHDSTKRGLLPWLTDKVNPW